MASAYELDLNETEATPDVRRARVRALTAFAAVAVGIVVAGLTPQVGSAGWLAVACLACAFGAAFEGALCRGAMLCAVFAFGSGWGAMRLHEADVTSLEHFRGDESVIATIEGRVVTGIAHATEPRGAMASFAYTTPSTRFELAATEVVTDDGTHAISGNVLVYAPVSVQVRAAQRVRVTGQLRASTGLNPGSNRNGRLSLRVPETSLIEVLAERPTTFTGRLIAVRDGARSRALDSLHASVPEDPARAFCEALLLGAPGNDEARGAFARVGLAHLMAISGFHVAVLLGLALLALRLTSEHPRLDVVLLACLVMLALLVIPARAPIVRACVMVLALVVGQASGRRHDRITVLAWIGTVMLVLRPHDLTDMGFQLSFGLVATLLWLGSRTHARLFGPRLRGIRRPRPSPLARIGRHLRLLVATTLLCWLVAVPIVICRTGMVSPLAIPATVVVFPLIVGLLGVGYTVLLLGTLVPSLADLLGVPLAVLAEATLALVTWIDGLPLSSLRIGHVSPVWGVAATAVILYWFAGSRTREVRAWLAAIGIVAWLAVEVRAGRHVDVPLRIDTLAVGDGTCHVVRSGDDVLLWDCGSMNADAGVTVIPRALRALGVHRVETIVITHANFDHYCAAPDVARAFDARRVLVGEAVLAQAADGGPESFLLDSLSDLEIVAVGRGDSVALGEGMITFLSPNGTHDSENDNSLVARVDVNTAGGARSILLTGDIETGAIEGLLPGLTGADVLEIPHHGSFSEEAVALLERVNPAVVLQSTGPRRAARTEWHRYMDGRRWYVTALHGASWVEFTREGRMRSGSRLDPVELGRALR